MISLMEGHSYLVNTTDDPAPLCSEIIPTNPRYKDIETPLQIVLLSLSLIISFIAGTLILMKKSNRSNDTISKMGIICLLQSV
jgi:hypothetical protein